MEQNNLVKFKPNVLTILIAILCLTAFGGLIFWQYQKPERKSDAIDKIDLNAATSGNTPANTYQLQKITQAESSYLQGTGQMKEKNYSEAIKFFDSAIAEDPYTPQYYSDKSEAQYNSGDKQGAIETLKQGASINPDSDLLKSKLDVLTKEQFSNPDIEAVRE